MGTQSLYQKHQEPFVAIVIDPKRTISSGKVDIGCFRTYPEDYVGKGSELETVPMDKIEDFGAHANKYYQLEHSIFKSELDQSQFEYLWNQYWVQTLSTSSLLNSKESVTNSIADISEKVNNYKNDPSLLRKDRLIGFTSGRGERGGEAPKKDNKIGKINKATKKVVLECSHMLMAEMIKSMIFSNVGKDSLDEEHKDMEVE